MGWLGFAIGHSDEYKSTFANIYKVKRGRPSWNLEVTFVEPSRAAPTRGAHERFNKSELRDSVEIPLEFRSF